MFYICWLQGVQKPILTVIKSIIANLNYKSILFCSHVRFKYNTCFTALLTVWFLFPFLIYCFTVFGYKVNNKNSTYVFEFYIKTAVDSE